jgi:Na+-driven multidrug efflux pump
MKTQFTENQRAYNLYVKKPLFLALMTVILPSLLMLLMSVVYIFASQIILVRLVPEHGTNTFQNLFHVSESEINSFIAQINSDTQHTGTVEKFLVSDAVRASMSISSPLAVIIASSPFFIADGTAVLFTQTLGHSNRTKANQVYKTGF